MNLVLSPGLVADFRTSTKSLDLLLAQNLFKFLKVFPKKILFPSLIKILTT